MRPNVRPMSLVDVPYVMPMYAAAVREETAQPGVPQYPGVPSPEVLAHEYGRVLIGSLDQPGFMAFVAAPVGKKPKGYVIGRLQGRVLGEPKGILLGEMLYVDPAFRHRALGHALVDALWTWGQTQGAAAFEAQHAPGSAGERIWLAAGFRPYLVRTVLATDAWAPRQDMPRRPVVSSRPDRQAS